MALVGNSYDYQQHLGAMTALPAGSGELTPRVATAGLATPRLSALSGNTVFQGRGKPLSVLGREISVPTIATLPEPCESQSQEEEDCDTEQEEDELAEDDGEDTEEEDTMDEDDGREGDGSSTVWDGMSDADADGETDDGMDNEIEPEAASSPETVWDAAPDSSWGLDKGKARQIGPVDDSVYGYGGFTGQYGENSAPESTWEFNEVQEQHMGLSNGASSVYDGSTAQYGGNFAPESSWEFNQAQGQHIGLSNGVPSVYGNSTAQYGGNFAPESSWEFNQAQEQYIGLSNGTSSIYGDSAAQYGGNPVPVPGPSWDHAQGMAHEMYPTNDASFGSGTNQYRANFNPGPVAPRPKTKTTQRRRATRTREPPKFPPTCALACCRAMYLIAADGSAMVVYAPKAAHASKDALHQYVRDHPDVPIIFPCGRRLPDGQVTPPPPTHPSGYCCDPLELVHTIDPAHHVISSMRPRFPTPESSIITYDDECRILAQTASKEEIFRQVGEWPHADWPQPGISQAELDGLGPVATMVYLGRWPTDEPPKHDTDSSTTSSYPTTQVTQYYPAAAPNPAGLPYSQTLVNAHCPPSWDHLLSEEFWGQPA